MPRLRQVTMQHFRGSATRSSIAFGDKALILLFGENGSGKSTVVDAIDLVCNDSYGTIDERSSATRKDHLPTIGSSTAQVEVQIDFDAGTWTGRLSSAGKALISGTSPRPAVRVLRRRSLLKLTEDTPGDRYKQLQSLIDVGQVERAEAQLKAAGEQVSRRLDDAVGRIRSAEETLENLWASEGFPEPDALTWAQARTATDKPTLHAQVDRLEATWTHLRDLKFAQSSLANAQVQAERTQQALEDLEIQRVEGGEGLDADLTQLLRDTLTYLDAAYPDACPTCQQAVDAGALRADLLVRLNASARLDELNALYRQAQHDHQDASRRLGEATEDLDDARKQAGRDHITFDEIDAAAHELAVLRGALEHHTGLRLALNTLREARQEALQHEATAGRLRAMQGTLRTTRLRYTQDLFDQVASEAQRLYQAIHPREPLGLTALELDPKKTASIHQKAIFHGHQGVAPQGFYSEAHLDTLGFCFWLAVIKHTTPDAIVVLDDVFTSVDATHLERIDALLLDEAQSGGVAQFLVITHYRGWLDKLRNGGIDQHLEVKELGRWDLGQGISVRGVLPNSAELRLKLAEPFLDRQAVASKAGVLLEAMLDQLTSQFRMSLPRQREYTLDPLLSAVADKAKKWTTTVADQLAQPWSPVLSRLKALAFIRNQVGAHFNLAGSDAADDDVREFAQATLALAELLFCPACGRRVSSKEHGAYWSCGGSCQQAQLHGP